MPWPLVGIGLSALGGLFGQKSKQTSTTTPTMATEYKPLQGLVLDSIMKRLQSSADLTGYGAQGVQNINRASQLAAQSQANNLAARGLSTSPVAAAVDATRTAARAGQVAEFQNSLPMLQRQLQGQDIQQAGNIMALGRGSTGTSETTSGGGLGGLFGGLGGMMGYLIGQGKFPGMGGGGVSPAQQAWWDYGNQGPVQG